MLDARLAQMIVDRMMSALSITVNIMDENGTVIAAGSKNRIGGFHMAAAEVIRTGRKKTVSEEEAKGMEGVLPGVTLPIVYKNKIIGAIGMTGDPQTVEPYGEIAAMTAVLMIEQEENRDRAFQQQLSKENLLLDLLRGRWSENEDFFHQRAQTLELDLEQHYIVMAACVVTDDYSLKTGALRELRGYVRSRLRDADSHLEGCFVNDTLALLYPVLKATLRKTDEQRALAENVLNHLRSVTDAPILICISGISEDWHNVPKLYQIAKGSLRVARTFNLKNGVFFSSDYSLEYTLATITCENRRNFCRSVLGGIFQAPDPQREMLINTLKVYFEHDKNVQETAEELFIHRNTLTSRFHRIEQLTGLTPWKFNDACVLRTAVILLQIEQEHCEGGNVPWDI